MGKYKVLVLTMVVLLSLGGPTFIAAQEDSYASTDQASMMEAMELIDLSLEEVMDIQTEVASNVERSLRESPGIITVITRADIANSGARDLIDVLHMIPGFVVAQDIVGHLSIGFRGIWAAEGKILLMVDGVPYNEMFYGTFILGNHYSVDQIEKVEVIRGPGSALYGGHAGLAVIKITTRGPELGGLHTSYMHGQQKGLNARNYMNLSYGNQYDELGISLSTSMKFGDGSSNQTYKDLFGGSYDLTDGSEYEQVDFNLGANYRNLKLRVVMDRYNYDNRSIVGDVLGLRLNRTFSTYQANLGYDWKVNEKLTIHPRISYRIQEPFMTEVYESYEGAPFPNGTLYHYVGSRIQGHLSALYHVQPNFNVTGGVEFYQDKGEMLELFNSRELADGYYDGEPDVTYTNSTFFAQAELYHDIANVTVGGRYDNHEELGAKFVPRLALTKKVDKFHVKALYSQAFRLPDIETINGAYATDEDGMIIFNEDGLPVPGEVEHEEIEVIELEVGYQVLENASLVANVYNGTVENPVVYRYVFNANGQGFDTYSNFGNVGTQGIEGELRVRDPKWGYVNLGYSYYQQTYDDPSDFTLYQVPSDDKFTYSFPAHKITLSGSFKVGEKLRINPTVHYFGERYGFEDVVYVGDFPVSALKKFDAVMLANLFINYQWKENIHLGIGVFDAFEENYKYLQPYDGYHGPFPAPSRELVVRLMYDVPF